MHKSRLAGFIIDCEETDRHEAAAFWSAALGMSTTGGEEPYVGLDASERDLAIEVQRVSHPSRLHLDIESTDVEAEARRLEALGAKRVAHVHSWIVMEAPTGHRFCVVRAKKPDRTGFNTWE